jgi:phosphoribosylformylglycinamidine cyclo-ligase
MLFLLLQKELGHQLKGLAHITGSGFLNIPRINEGFDYQIELPDTFFIKDEFIELKKRAAMSWSEAFTTWNMGVGLVVIVESVLATRVTSLLNRAGYPTHILGIVEKSKSSTSGKKQSSVVSVVSDEFKFSLKY